MAILGLPTREATRAVSPSAREQGSTATPVSERWTRVLEEARGLGGDNLHLGHLLYLDRKRRDAGLYAMSPAWVRHFADFYASGAFEDVGRFGVRAAKSDSVCCAITGEVLMVERTLSVVGVCPIMSANMREAGDRFQTIQENLRAMGFRDISGSKADVEPWTFKAQGGGASPYVVKVLDAQDHPCEFRVYPASEAGAAGFTGIAGFGDELDLWGKADGANPAAKVLRVLRSRYATQPQAKLHLMSATYDRESEHARLVGMGNVAGQYVARIGEDGARADHAARLRLARSIGSTDPLLVAPPLPPDCNDIPSWVTNPIAPIESAYAKSKGDLREMFGLYGGRLALAGKGSTMTLEDALFMAEQNRELSRPLATRVLSDDGLFDYTGIPGAGSAPGRYRGL